METVNNNDKLKHKVILLFLPWAALAVLIFTLISFFLLKQYLLGTFQAITLVVLIAAIPICLKTRKVVLAGNILGFLGLVTLMPWIITGGYELTGFWWSIVYVVGAFFVSSNRWAVFWVTIYFIIAVVIICFSVMGYFKIAYTVGQLLNLLLMYILTFGFVYQFNEVGKYYLAKYNERAEELATKNQQLIAANKEVKIKNKELEQFTYITSHDLQEPLRTISNFVYLLEKKLHTSTDDETNLYFNFIAKATVKMQNLIKDLLNLSRVGKVSEMKMVNCNQVLETVKNELNAAIKESDAKITSSYLPTIKATEVELIQLFQNLLSNAIKFREKGVSPIIEIKCVDKENEFLFTVKDNGIGIEELYQEKIFVIFQRLHNDTEYAGTGIGLAICKKIIEQHQGEIGVKSKPNQGSEFYFTLPKS